MKKALLLVSLNLVSLTLIAFAGVLSYYDKSGWGWFLFFGVVCGKTYSDTKGGDF